ncbi:MAG: hypothetical protein HWD58_09660 [Bacteroidota bacterium]|nr:MAG: hypothetical protein HWD58_09660 [Bacteroidota bacterium]
MLLYTLITSQLNFPSTNPPSTAFDQVKWDEKFTVYYKLTFGNNCLGSINYSIRGGSGNYTVLIDGQNNTQNLSFGAHTFSVQDVNNPTCVFTFGFDLKFDGIGLNPNCVNSNGYIFANKGGVPNLTYSISPNIGTQNPAGTFSNLPAGTYIITASGSGCSITTTITLYQPNANHCCTTTSNPNAGSNIASMPYIILLPNTQVANLTSANLLSNYGSNGVIQGKKFYIDGILTIDADITLDACELWFTSTSSIALDATHDLNMINNTILQASCDWWGGITASNSANKITMTNSTLKNAKFGLHVLNDALIEINGSTFADCGQHAIYMSQMNLNPYPGFILNTTISSQNNLPSTI